MCVRLSLLLVKECGNFKLKAQYKNEVPQNSKALFLTVDNLSNHRAIVIVCFVRLLQGAASHFRGLVVLNGGGSKFCRRFCGLKLWILEKLNFHMLSEKCRLEKEFRRLRNQDRTHLTNNLETGLSNDEGSISDSSSNLHVSNGWLAFTNLEIESSLIVSVP